MLSDPSRLGRTSESIRRSDKIEIRTAIGSYQVAGSQLGGGINCKRDSNKNQPTKKHLYELTIWALEHEIFVHLLCYTSLNAHKTEEK